MTCRVLITTTAENDLQQLGFSGLQILHVIELMLRLQDFDDPAMVSDMDIDQCNHFHEVRKLRDAGGPLVNRFVQIRFGVVEKHNNDIVVLQITDTHEDPDCIGLIRLEDRYAEYLELVMATDISR